ncbi:hypothetical protein CHARACLAT_018556 [Characodon lateralis]|uniref:Secreted protein n=1 Tax=Characodon lateralis TaxID=208331 RepID=A0ABU7EV26_9TELE|nr:hypothetical protein [Characodon lateralis]
MKGLCLSAGLGTPWAPPGGAGGGVWGEGRLGISTESAESAAPATRSRISGRRRVRVRHSRSWSYCCNRCIVRSHGFESLEGFTRASIFPPASPPPSACLHLFMAACQKALSSGFLLLIE